MVPVAPRPSSRRTTGSHHVKNATVVLGRPQPSSFTGFVSVRSNTASQAARRRSHRRFVGTALVDGAISRSGSLQPQPAPLPHHGAYSGDGSGSFSCRLAIESSDETSLIPIGGRRFLPAQSIELFIRPHAGDVRHTVRHPEEGRDCSDVPGVLLVKAVLR